MITSLMILLNRFITFICKLFHKNGSVLPGYIIHEYFRQKRILEKIKYPKYVIAVTGSSGKGSTTNLIYHILTQNGYDVCYNQNGSNGMLAAITLILNNTKLNHQFKHEVLLLECDERHLKLIFKKNKMSHLIITNVTRDQPARNGEPNLVFNDIISAIGKDTKIIINADDPLVNRLSLTHKNIVKYGVNKTPDSYIKSTNFSVDYAYCPTCHKKLLYDYYHYGHIGSYKCPNGCFTRGNLNYKVTKVDYENHTIKINNQEVYLNKDVLFAVYYTLSAYALCREIGITEEQIDLALNKNKPISKRGKVLKIGRRNLTMLETKNENNLSYYQSLKFINNQQGTKSIILGFDNVSRRYHFNDLSWLWDVNFELLEDPNIDKIFVIGRFKYDILTRLSFTNIQKEKLILVDDLNDLINLVKKESKGDIYTMVCFDMTANILKLIEGDNK